MLVWLMCIVFINLVSAVHGGTIHNLSFEKQSLYPVQKAYNQGYLQVSDLHRIFYAEFGNPKGVPVLVVHGGPGAGCSDNLTAFFDPICYRVIMFDQRGAMRSQPFAEMEDNTPQASVHDMELLRTHLNIDRWILFGGSYGSLLSVLYGETHPKNVLYFVLRGVFLGREKDYHNIFYSMGKFFPEAWNDMVALIPQKKQDILIHSLHRQVMDRDPLIHIPAAYAFMYYDTLCASMNPHAETVKKNLSNEVALSIGRAFIHYSVHTFFLKNNQLLENINNIAHIPAIIVHGRYDLICPPENAYELHKLWHNSELWFVANAGHSAYEPSLAQGLKTAMDRIKETI